MKNRSWIGFGVCVLAVAAAGIITLSTQAADLATPGVVPVDTSRPAIHGPRVVGTTPGRPFLFLIPATGKGPLHFEAQGLPAGLKLDAASGIISGAVEKEGVYAAKVRVSGAAGSAERTLNIVAGQGKLALTPSLGWNSWNAWGLAVDDGKVRAAADAMINSGLASHGFQYVNIDDGWEAGRADDGEILTNIKFPDMKALADYVHGRGLKIGIYSSPGPSTCGHFEGSFGHEAQDVTTYARWGIDYLKYDWCSYKVDVKGAGPDVMKDRLTWFKAPYDKMGKLLALSPRDIVYCICFYGLWDVEKWGASVGGNQWRTTGDITDTWKSLSEIGFKKQTGKEKYAGPGHWNDPDMLIVGQVGWGPNLHPTRLTNDEQTTHISLWCLLAAPLLIGCDMTNFDPFTLSLLTNDEALDIDQDPLGQQASRRAKHGDTEIWARPLWDGTLAVGLFNLSPAQQNVTFSWSELALTGPQPIRDLWRHQDLGDFNGSFVASVPSHGVVLLKVGKATKEDFSIK